MIDRRKLDDTMDELSFAESLSGTPLIRAAVAMVDAQRDIAMTKELYPGLAKAHGITAAAVERRMRNAIVNAVECCDHVETSLAWRRFIGGQSPTVGEVVTRLARRCSFEK